MENGITDGLNAKVRDWDEAGFFILPLSAPRRGTCCGLMKSYNPGRPHANAGDTLKYGCCLSELST